MKLPRDISGQRLATLLGRFGYESSRQTGSHLRLTSRQRGPEHHITIPMHKTLPVGTLSAILSDVAEYLDLDKSAVAESLFD